MKTVSAVTFGALFVLAALFLIAPGAAEALTNAPAGTPIVNKASVNYKIGGVAQTVIESSPTGNSTAGAGSGTNTSFLVDAKVNFQVTTVDVTNVPAYAGGATDTYYLTFRVTNWSNTGLDFGFSTFDNTTNPFTSAAEVDASTAWAQGINSYRVDSNGNCTYETGTDTATFIDELAMSQNRCVFWVAGAIPSDQTYGDEEAITLIATAYYNGTTGGVAGGGSGAVVSDSDGDNNGGVNSIDWELNDAGANGYESSDSAFVYRIATLTVTKRSRVISDPINSTTNPIAIPGAFIDYTITVSNAASGSAATDLSITDDLDSILPAYAVYNSGHLLYNDGASWTAQTDAEDGDQAFLNTTTNEVTFNRFDLTNGATKQGVFRIELQ